MQQKDTSSCHSEHSRGIPLDQIVWNDTPKKSKYIFSTFSFVSSFFWSLNFKSATKSDTSTPLGMTNWGSFPKTNNEKTKTLSHYSLFPNPSQLFPRLGFTLVELIVVITILTILGTIAFTQIGSFQSSARDSARVSDINNIRKGLDIFQITSGSYPMPEGTIVYTGSIEGVTYSYLGEIGDMITQVARVNKTPHDPISDNRYVYGVTTSKKEYQIAASLENADYAYTPFVSPIFADGGYSALVDGNYRGYIKFASGSETWIANVPSLIFASTGSVSLLSSGTYFVVNRNTNLPYKVQSDTVTQNKPANQIVQEITKSTEATLMGVNITGITKDTIASVFTGATLVSFALSGNGTSDTTGALAFVEQAVLGSSSATVSAAPANSCITQPVYTWATFTEWSPTSPNQAWQGTTSTGACYYTCGAWNVLDENICVSETCAGTTPDGTAKVSNATSFAGGTWNYNPAGAKCSYTCGTGYHTEDNGVSCVEDTRSCTIANWVWSQTWTTSWGACSVVSCNANYTASGTTACTYQTAPIWWNFTMPSTTNSTSVTLTITCPTDATGSTPIQMYISWAWLASGWNVWETCVSSKNITVTTWDGSKAIAMKWRDSVGNESGVMSGSVGLSLRWEDVYTTPGTYTWMAPAGVTSVSMVCVGGGGAGIKSTTSNVGGDGGGWGALAYTNNLSVTSGQTLEVVVGAGGVTGIYTASTDSLITQSLVIKLLAKGGSFSNGAGGFGGDAATCIGSAAYSGGKGGSKYFVGGGYAGAGGGGAGGYSGAGGNGGPYTTNTDGTGGGGGGGTNFMYSPTPGSGGGGVGLYGLGVNGTKGVPDTIAECLSTNPPICSSGGGGGSEGGSWHDITGPLNFMTTVHGGSYGGGGGGGGGMFGSGNGGNGGGGACRIIWPGNTRQFPSTNVWP